MRNPNNNDQSYALPEDADDAFAQLVMRYQDETLTAEEMQSLNAILGDNPQRLEQFVELQKTSAALHNVLRQEIFEVRSQADSIPSGSFWKFSGSRWIAGNVSTLLLASVLFLGAWSIFPGAHRINPVASQGGKVPVTTATQEASVELAGFSRAKFFGELLPEIHSILAEQRPYVLTEGMVELAFPTGATAIVEAPAVFRILGHDRLAMDTGRCSVHAPDGAEGFRLETPISCVVDRGTRFSVNVSETSETEVQVIEGEADVYSRTDHASPVTTGKDKKPEARLNQFAAQRLAGTAGAVTSVPMAYSAESYRHQLPDRVVKYEADVVTKNRVDQLRNVTVQRAGQMVTYDVDDLIPMELIWFKSRDHADRSGHLSGYQSLSKNRANWLSDRSLITGVINPGGQKTPLTSNPVVQFPEDPQHPNTPGFAVRFEQPVVNGPGPDVVFFELQTLTNSPDGDPIHVSPMTFENGRRSMTVKIYDLGLTSPAALPLTDFYLYQFPQALDSIESLTTSNCVRTQSRLGFRAMAVGIDLSQMGYAENEEVSELFFQDADDDDAYVDPVFIAGLPAHAVPPSQKNAD